MMANLTKGIADIGYPVDLVLFNKSGGHLEKIPPNVNIVDLKVNRALNSIGRVANYLKTNNPYAMISTLSRVNVAAVLAKKISRAETKLVLREANTFSVYTEGSAGLMDKIIYRVAKFTYRFGDHIVAGEERHFGRSRTGIDDDDYFFHDSPAFLH